MKGLFKQLSVEKMKESKIDRILTNFSHREDFSQLLWNVAVYIQHDLGLAIHCHNTEKVKAYESFLTESFVRSIFKVRTSRWHISSLQVSSFADLESSFNDGHFTHSAIDIQSIERKFGVTSRIGQKRSAGEIDSQDDSDTEPISDKLARLAPKSDEVSIIRSPKIRKKPKVNAPAIVKQEVEDTPTKHVQVPVSVTILVIHYYLEINQQTLSYLEYPL